METDEEEIRRDGDYDDDERCWDGPFPAEIAVLLLEWAVADDPGTARAAALVCRRWNALHGSLRALDGLRRRAAPMLYADLLLTIVDDSGLTMLMLGSVIGPVKAARVRAFQIAGRLANRSEARRLVGEAVTPRGRNPWFEYPAFGPSADLLAATLWPLLANVGPPAGPTVVPFALAFGESAHADVRERGLVEWLRPIVSRDGCIRAVRSDSWSDSVSDRATFGALWRFLHPDRHT